MSKLRFNLMAIALVTATGANYAAAQQSVPGKEIPGQTQPSPGQERTAPPVQPGQDQSRLSNNQQGVSVQDALVKKLMKANDGEIELAQMMQDKVEEKDFRQFTSMVIEDHQALNQQLKKMTSAPRAGNRENEVQPSTKPASQDNASQPNRQPAIGDEPNREAQNRQAPQGHVQMGLVPQQLCNIMEEACETNLKMTKEMLGQYQGSDLKMAYLGQQCVAHTMMLAELKAIHDQGPNELKSVAQQAMPKVQHHLDMAKQLSKKYAGEHVSTNRTSSADSKQESDSRR